MAWATGRSKRDQELKAIPGWLTRIRPEVRARAGGRCEALLHSGERCPERGTDCHHTNRDDHTLAALLWLCSWHHDVETGKQGAAGRAVTRAKLKFPNETLD